MPELKIDLPPDVQESVNHSVDVADLIMLQSLDFARNEISFADRAKHEVSILAIAHAEIAVRVFLARERKA